MKNVFAFSVLSLLVGVTALAQDAPAQPDQNRAAGRRDPNIVSPGPTPGLRPPDAPTLPYHFYIADTVNAKVLKLERD